MYVVYDHPRDYPDWFVCRIWFVYDAPAGGPAGGGGALQDLFLKAETLDAIRVELESRGLHNIGRFADDDPVIVEVWI